MNPSEKPLTTDLFSKRKHGNRFTELRVLRIEEAISWTAGPSLDSQLKHVVNSLPDGTEVYFLKPGKEAYRETNRKIHDMAPNVGVLYGGARFDHIWGYISHISTMDFDGFKDVLTLIYRSAFLLDHVLEENRVRYRPSKEITDTINGLERKIAKAPVPGGLWGLLNFLDILGWNEDVKYHSEENEATFTGQYGYYVGRVNTLLSCIRVPYQMSSFVREVILKADHPSDIDFDEGYQVMQQFAKSRGTCTPTNTQLLEWLGTNLHD